MRRFDVHHLFDCGKLSMEYDRVKSVSRLITYCHTCHMSLESVKKKMATKTGNFKNSRHAHKNIHYRKKLSTD